MQMIACAKQKQQPSNDYLLIWSKARSSEGSHFGHRGEIGWILEDNQGMVAIADTINSKINREYVIYSKQLDQTEV